MQLSRNFTLYEFCFSETAARMGKKIEPDEKVIHNLTALCIHVLQPIRDKLDKPIRITSGYRPKWLNEAIKGSKTSQHIEGKAADIQVYGVSTEELFQFIKRNIHEYDQLIQEFDSWVHISWNGCNNRNMALRAIKQNGKTKYIAA